jgi:hypothetical protein
MKKTIGYKSKGEIAIFFFAIIIFLIIACFPLAFLFIHGVVGEMIFVLIVVICFEAVFIIQLTKQMGKPNDLVQYDEQYLYLNYRGGTTKIKLQSIIQATPRRASARGFAYRFGTILIHTSIAQYKIGTVAACEDVCLEIMRLARAANE